jgi:hypothetical protein
MEHSGAKVSKEMPKRHSAAKVFGESTDNSGNGITPPKIIYY